MPNGLSAGQTGSPESSLIASYRTDPSVYDEMWEPRGGVRAHWSYLLETLSDLGPGELHQRNADTRRLLRENGVTYNVYDDTTQVNRSWLLDPIPLLMTGEQWSTIETGLVQRAELWNQIFTDLYGPRNLIRTGVIPPELVDGNPDFLRPCFGTLSPKRKNLLTLACDLVRRADGQHCVLSDRLQAPSGSGYALENRLILSRVFPTIYRESHVHRLANYFRSFLSTLAELAPAPVEEDPKIVMLTPGPDAETYFEHAYLANYLGVELVQGSDLEVRDSKVWFHTLTGLEQVDVILRRVDQAFCDPVELRPDSLLGVPGLLHAVRAGTVAVVNPVGTGVLENPAFQAFLPKLALALLGEELILPSVSTWWCGVPEDRQFVLDNLEKLVIKPMNRTRQKGNIETFFGGELSKKRLERLATQIREKPECYAAQAQCSLSTAPTHVNGQLEPRSMVLRGFATAFRDSYTVMPGGLTRVAPEWGSSLVSGQKGGVSKDTWVLATEPQRFVTLLPMQEKHLILTRRGGEIAPRVANNLYWLGRYTERTDSSIRIVREAVLGIVGSISLQVEDFPTELLRAVTRFTETFPGFAVENKEILSRPEPEIFSLIADASRLGSVRYNIDCVLRTATAIRDRLSSDAWRVLNKLEQASFPADLGRSADSLETCVMALGAFAGYLSDSMTRGSAYRFVQIGRRLERAIGTLRLLQFVFFSGSPPSEALMATLLAVTDSGMTYRRRYQSRLRVGPIFDLLLQDESSPRSVAYQLASLQELVALLTPQGTPPARSVASKILTDAYAILRSTDFDFDADASDDETIPQMHSRTLMRAESLLRDLSNEITATHLISSAPPQQLVEL